MEVSPTMLHHGPVRVSLRDMRSLPIPLDVATPVTYDLPVRTDQRPLIGRLSLEQALVGAGSRWSRLSLEQATLYGR
jgi:hypothetical protein